MNYIGSKLSILDFLVESIEQICGTNPGVFADLFAGTGAVGTAFRKKGFYVIANDIQHYSYVLNRHYIENSDSIEASIVAYLNSLEGTEGFVYNSFCQGSGSGRNYFTDFNGKNAMPFVLKLILCTAEMKLRKINITICLPVLSILLINMQTPPLYTVLF